MGRRPKPAPRSSSALSTANRLSKPPGSTAVFPLFSQKKSPDGKSKKSPTRPDTDGKRSLSDRSPPMADKPSPNDIEKKKSRPDGTLPLAIEKYTADPYATPGKDHDSSSYAAAALTASKTAIEQDAVNRRSAKDGFSSSLLNKQRQVSFSVPRTQEQATASTAPNAQTHKKLAGRLLPRRTDSAKLYEPARSSNIHEFRLDIRVPMEITDSETDALALFRKNLIDALYNIVQHNSDLNLAVMPWLDINVKRCDDVLWDELPTTKNDLRKYVKSMYLRPNEDKPIYTAVHLAHSCPLEELEEHLSLLPGDFGDPGYWRSTLQVDDAIEIGWLKLSTYTMDTVRLSKQLTSLAGVPIGLRWKNVYGFQDEDGNKASALHVSVSKRTEARARAFVDKFYNSTSKIFPNNTRMRLVPFMSRDRADETEDAQIDAAVIQIGFLKAIRRIPCSGIRFLDTCPEGCDFTAREMMMGICVSNRPEQPLFHSIDKDKYGKFTVTVLPQFLKEAKLFLAGMVVRCRTHYGDKILALFTKDAIHAASKHRMDKNGVVVTEEDDELRAVVYNEADAAYHFEIDLKELKNNSFSKALDAARCAVAELDNDEITQFSFTTTKRDAQKDRRTASSNKADDKDDDDPGDPTAAAIAASQAAVINLMEATSGAGNAPDEHAVEEDGSTDAVISNELNDMEDTNDDDEDMSDDGKSDDANASPRK